MLFNYMEKYVDIKLGELLDKYTDVCTCDKCLDDVKAIALNNLKPLYVVTNKGETFKKIDSMATQYNVDVMKEIVAGFKKVSESPQSCEYSRK